MTNERAALGGMLEQLVDLGVIEFSFEPLDAIVERRLMIIWTSRACPNCDVDTLHALDGSARIWCGRCDWKPSTPAVHHSTTRNSLPASSSSPSFSTPIPSSASIKSRRCLTAPTKPSSTRSTTWKPRSFAASRPSGNAWATRSLGQRGSMKLSRFARDLKARTHRETDCLAAGCQSPAEHDGQESRATR